MTFDGIWDLTVTSPMGAKVFRLDIRTVDGKVQGTCTTGGETSPMMDPVLQDGRLRWATRLPRPMNVVLELDLACSGDVLSGSAKAGHMVLDGVKGVRVG
jgi:hypothetical protein